MVAATLRGTPGSLGLPKDLGRHAAGRVLLLVVWLSGCAGLPTDQELEAARETARPLAESPADCRRRLYGTNSDTPKSYGFRDTITLASWNVQKARGKKWHNELRQLSDRADILLLQEAPVAVAAAEVLPHPYVAVAEGFRSHRGPSGLITASHVAPLGSCSFIDREPLLRSRKASTLARYPLARGDEALLVAHVHAVNFTLGLGAFRRQLTRLALVLHDHRGPAIFAGDFNVWHSGRERWVQTLMENLGLRQLDFQPDRRKRVFGYALDRIYARGLPVARTETPDLSSSDHDPMIVTWRLQQ